MAMEGHYDSHPNGAPLILFGIPNSEEKRVDYALEIPKASSLILKHDLNAPMAGLDTIPDENEPPVGVVFWSFRSMVGRSEGHTSELQSLIPHSDDGICLKQ